MSKSFISLIQNSVKTDPAELASSEKESGILALSHERPLVSSTFSADKLSSNLLTQVENRKKETSSLSIPNKHPVLGVYLSEAEDCKSPSYQDISQKTIYTKKVKKMGGAWALLMPDYGAAGSVATGSLMEGSYQVIVKGHDGLNPKSWEIRSWLPIGRDPYSGHAMYGWRNACLPMEKALKLEGVQDVIKHFSQNSKSSKSI